MLYILSGQDDYSLRQCLAKVKEGIGDQTLLAANTTSLDGQQLTAEQLGAVCGAMPFLAEKRLVIVTGLLGRFEPRAKGRQKKTAHTADRQKECAPLAACINYLPDSTMLVLIDDKVGNDNPLFRQISDRAETKSFPPLTGARLRQWVQRQVAEQGTSISPRALGLLVEYIGSDLWIMASEIDKLVIFTSGRPIEEEDVRSVVSYAQQANIFAMIDAVLESRAGAAQRLLEQLLANGVHPAHLLVLLARRLQMIVRAIELKKQGRPEAEIQSKLGLTSEFALSRRLEQAGKYSLERVKQVYLKLLETDLAIKTGKYQGELALNILVAELCQERSR